LSYEFDLVALAILLYLYDSAVLLYSNEAVLTRDSSNRWTAKTGWEGLGIGGRLVYVLNPFAPHRPSFRLSWNYHSSVTEATSAQPWPQYASQLRPLAAIGPLVGLGLFVVLPAGLFTVAGSYAVISALVTIYGSTIVGLLLLYRSRAAIPLSAARFATIAFECLLCPPLAVNVLRRTTLAFRIEESLPTAAARLLVPEEWARLREHCIRRLDDAIQFLPDGSEEAGLLEAQKQRLRDMA
jgi:hypothetical protein